MLISADAKSLTFIKYNGISKHKKSLGLYLCCCGNLCSKIISEVKSGHTTSCGCLKGRHTHGKTYTRSYQTWADMKTRCDNPNHKSYKFYGGRGISYSSSWKDFETFYEDMGERPVGYTLERVDNNQHYSKDNCIWTTRAEQNRNTSRCLKNRIGKEGNGLVNQC